MPSDEVVSQAVDQPCLTTPADGQPNTNQDATATQSASTGPDAATQSVVKTDYGRDNPGEHPSTSVVSSSGCAAQAAQAACEGTDGSIAHVEATSAPSTKGTGRSQVQSNTCCGTSSGRPGQRTSSPARQRPPEFSLTPGVSIIEFCKVIPPDTWPASGGVTSASDTARQQQAKQARGSGQQPGAAGSNSHGAAPAVAAGKKATSTAYITVKSESYMDLLLGGSGSKGTIPSGLAVHGEALWWVDGCSS